MAIENDPAQSATSPKPAAATPAKAATNSKTRTSTKAKAKAKAKPTGKAAPKRKAERSPVRKSAEKALHVYLGVIGKGLDSLEENMESARKKRERRVKELEKRGSQLRKEIKKRVDDYEVKSFDELYEDGKARFEKLQRRAEEATADIREKLSLKKAA